jgi:hypothetical protein
MQTANMAACTFLAALGALSGNAAIKGTKAVGDDGAHCRL